MIRTVLSLTCDEATVDPLMEPALHLFTDRPREAAELAYAGAASRRPIRLHLLKPVELEGRSFLLHELLN